MVKHWKGQGKKVSMSKGQKSTAPLLGVEAKVVTWNTSDEDGPVTATLTTLQIDGVYFLLSQIITKEADRGSADKLKKAAASLALAGGGKAVASAPTAPKEASPAKLIGDLPGAGKLIVRQHVLRNAKGKAFLCAVASTGPLDAEARAVVDSLTSLP